MHELVLFPIERVEQHDAAHPAPLAADGQRIDGRKVAAAVGDDHDRHPPEGAARGGVEIAELGLGLVEERGEAAGRPEFAPRSNRARRGRAAGTTSTPFKPELGELAHDLLAGDDVALQRRVVAVKEDDDDSAARPG